MGFVPSAAPVVALGRARVTVVDRVVVGVDARRPDDVALDVAFEEAALRGARLRAVHAWDLPALYRDTALGAAAAPYSRTSGSTATSGYFSRRPRSASLVRASAGAELLVVGRGPRSAVCLGGVVHAVAHHTRCPLLLTRAR